MSSRRRWSAYNSGVRQSAGWYEDRPIDPLTERTSAPTPIHTIGDNVYALKWKVKSESKPDKVYTVSLRHDGNWECSCPHWIFRGKREGFDCKHIVYIRSTRNLDNDRETMRESNGQAIEVVVTNGRLEGLYETL